MPDCHTLIISDIHLGSRVSRTDKVLALLQGAHFKDLIINGDLFDSADMEKLTPADWEIINLISDVTKKHYAVLVGGNHGRELDKMAQKMGLRVIDNHAFKVGGRKFLCLHGDEFDMLVRRLPSTTKIFTQIYYFIQLFGGKKQRVSIFLKKVTKKLFGLTRRQERLAVQEGITKQANVVICSHTHIPHVSHREGVLFVNSGSFCNNPSTYITIARNGLVQLCEI